MAKGFRRTGRGTKERFVARLDDLERSVVTSLLRQTLELIAPAEGTGGRVESAVDAASSAPASAPDTFEAIVAGLDGLGDASGPHGRTLPEDARSFGDGDPAIRRLFPAANRTDEQASAEFRRLTEQGMRRRKAENLEQAVAVLSGRGEAIELSRAQAVALLVSLTDVRLVLGERLALRQDEDVERLEAITATLPDDHPVAQAVMVYDFLTWLQETLAHALM